MELSGSYCMYTQQRLYGAYIPTPAHEARVIIKSKVKNNYNKTFVHLRWRERRTKYL